MWIARDKDGKLYFYNLKPDRIDNYFRCSFAGMLRINPDLFPEVTWENSPVEVELKLTKEIVGVAESPSKTFSRVNDFEVGASYRR